MTKKIILFIVEGITDKRSLGLILSRIFKAQNVRFHIVGTDISTQYTTDATGVVKKINAQISKFQNNIYKDSDILKVIHLIDTDGAFIPEEKVIYGKVHKIAYKKDCILTKHVDAVVGRNKVKSQNVKVLSSLKFVKRKIPYSIYYFSCNLEHVLHNKNDVPDDQKRKYAEFFQDKYIDNEDAFVKFLCSNNFSVNDSYEKSWEFIQTGCNSLNRHSNFCLEFKNNAHKRIKA